MEKLKIKVHSVVDIITNSSTTIYTQADTGTISSIKEMVNALLSIGGSKLIADDLFTFSLYNEREMEYKEDALYNNSPEFLEKYEAINNTLIEKYGATYTYSDKFFGDKDQFNIDYADSKKQKSSLVSEYLELCKDEVWVEYKPDYDDYSSIELIVSIKSDDKNAIIAGSILNNLDNLFNHEASYN